MLRTGHVKRKTKGGRLKIETAADDLQPRVGLECKRNDGHDDQNVKNLINNNGEPERLLDALNAVSRYISAPRHNNPATIQNQVRDEHQREPQAVDAIDRKHRHKACCVFEAVGKQRPIERTSLRFVQRFKLCLHQVVTDEMCHDTPREQTHSSSFLNHAESIVGRGYIAMCFGMQRSAVFCEIEKRKFPISKPLHV